MMEESAISALCGRDEFQSDFDVVADFPRSEFSVEDVRRAGGVIAGDLHWSDETAQGIRQAFQVANNWRDAHAYPMRSVRYQLLWYMRHNKLEGVTVARLKRMQAIRRKLRKTTLRLHQLQDLGGCRAILPSIADVHTLVDVLRDKSCHELRAESDYIGRPKIDGYRSHHLMFSYRGSGGATIHDDRRIEVQIRTRLQHSWATAVEAVGLFRGEDLKGNRGSAKWLRLFTLMSAEFALVEECAEPPNVPPHHDRAAEIRVLDEELSAAKTLEKLSYAVRWTDEAVSPSSRPTYYLIEFDNATREVNIQLIFAPKWAVARYDSAEFTDNRNGEEKRNVVLVEADKLENLKDAYPNYFGDVQLFKLQLKKITQGKELREYVVRPQETVAPRPRENPDLSWFKRRIRWR